MNLQVGRKENGSVGGWNSCEPWEKKGGSVKEEGRGKSLWALE